MAEPEGTEMICNTKAALQRQRQIDMTKPDDALRIFLEYQATVSPTEA